MIDSKENYKFDLWVKGLNNLKKSSDGEKNKIRVIYQRQQGSNFKIWVTRYE